MNSLISFDNIYISFVFRCWRSYFWVSNYWVSQVYFHVVLHKDFKGYQFKSYQFFIRRLGIVFNLEFWRELQGKIQSAGDYALYGWVTNFFCFMNWFVVHLRMAGYMSPKYNLVLDSYESLYEVIRQKRMHLLNLRNWSRRL